MSHILQKSHEELSRTHDILENYHYKSLKGFFYSFFGKSFKNILHIYAHKKEEILINYSSLYSDFLKDINDSHATPTDIEHVRESIYYITKTISECGEILESLVGHTKRQTDILHHEKVFFTQLLESFRGDLITWTQKHEAEIFGEISQLEKQQYMTPLQEGKALLELQKKRLETHINSLHTFQNNHPKT